MTTLEGRKATMLASACADAANGTFFSFSEDVNVDEMMEVLEMMDQREKETFFEKLFLVVSNSITNICVNSEDDDDDCLVTMSVDNDHLITDIICSLKKVATMLFKMSCNSPSTDHNIVQTVQLLHELLIPLDDAIPGANQLKSSISRLCEKWWINQDEGAENIIIQLVPYLLITALSSSSRDIDAKRLYNVRGALLLFDFDDESIESIRSLILRCFIHPTFLKVAEGRRFLSFIFTIHTGLNSLVFQVIRPQLAVGAHKISTSYGDVLVKAWRELADMAVIDNDDALLVHFEEMLQSLIHDCLHAVEQSYFRGLRFALNVFHEAKRLKGIDALLLRLYGPILFRSLRCANAVVRAQATMVFFDAFPLQDTNATAKESEVILQKQFDLLSSLLKDDDHRVRAAAASGVCHVLREYWEALPTQTTHRILSYVVGTLGFDSSSPSVRLAVVSGLGQVLEQPLAHSVLKGLLPLLSNALHDKSQAVRLAFVQLLNKVKDIRGIHFYQIVSIEHLQRRLAVDAGRPRIRSAITELLLKSFYPQQQQPSTSSLANNQNQVLRCLRFVKENLPASIAFYSTFHKFTSVGSASKLLIMLLALFTKPTTFWRDFEAVQDPGDMVHDRQDGTESSDRVLQVSVLRVMAACLDSIALALSSPEHGPSRDLLLKYFTPQTVTNITDVLSEGVGHDVASTLFLQSVATVWKLKEGADNNSIWPHLQEMA